MTVTNILLHFLKPSSDCMSKVYEVRQNSFTNEQVFYRMINSSAVIRFKVLETLRYPFTFFTPKIYSVWSNVKFIFNWKVRLYKALSIHVGECKILPQNLSSLLFFPSSFLNDRNNTGILIVLLKLASRIRAVTWRGSCTLLSAWMTHTITWSHRCHNLEKRQISRSRKPISKSRLFPVPCGGTWWHAKYTTASPIPLSRSKVWRRRILI